MIFFIAICCLCVAGNMTDTYAETEIATPAITTNGGNDYSTADPAIILEGTCHPNTDKMYVNGSEQGVTFEPTIIGDGSWTYTGTLPASGPNTFEITVADLSGTLSDPASITVTLDNTPPVSEAMPPGYGNKELSISWTASDDFSGVASAKLWYKKEAEGTWNNTGISQDGESGTFAYTPSEGEGSYYFATRATDNMGNREAKPLDSGDGVTIYDTTAPPAPEINPEPLISGTSVTLTGTCFTGAAAVYVNGSADGVAFNAEQGSWTYTGTFQEGDVFKVTAQDGAGNVSPEASITVSRDDYDSTPPVSTVMAPEYANSDITIDWSISDDKSGPASAELWYKKEDPELAQGGEWINTGISRVGDSGVFEFTLWEGEGAYHFAAQAIDFAGNLEAAPEGEADVITIYDITPPEPPVINEDYTITGNSVTLTGTCTADVTGIFVNAATAGVTYTPGETSWSYTGPIQTDGTTFSMTAQDAAGNLSTESSIVVTPEAPSDTEPPTSLITSAPAYGNGELSIPWTASDDVSGVASAELWYKKEAEGEWLNTGISQTGNSGTFAFTPSDGDGNYYFSAQAIDKAGNVETDPSGDGDAVTVYDSTLPETPVIETNSGDDYTVADNSAVTLTGTCAADISVIYVNGGTEGVTYTPGATDWTYSSGTLKIGANTFEITAGDITGNISSGAVMTITYAPPTSGSITLGWEPNAESDLSHYVLYWGTISRNYTENSGEIDKAADTYTVANLNQGQIYYFGIKAFSTSGESSDFSNEAAIPAISKPLDGFAVNADNDSSYTVSGTSAELAEVQIFSDDTLIGTATASGAQSGATWSANVDFTSVTGETLTLTALSTGATSAAISGTYDKGALLSAIVTSAPEYGNGELSIEWAATDADAAPASAELWYKKSLYDPWANTGLPAQSGTGGTFTYTPSEGDGIYYFAMRSADSSGTPEPPPTGNGHASITFDTVPPAAPEILTQSGNDFIQTETSLSLDGTCEPDTGMIHVNGSANGVSHTAGRTVWSYSGTLKAGDNSFAVTALDAAGNESVEAVLHVTYDESGGGEPSGEVSIVLEWDANTRSDLEYYILRWGTGTRNYTHDSGEIAGSATSHTVTDLAAGQLYYFSLRAFYSGGMVSEYSNEAAIPAISSPSEGFQVNSANDTAYTVSGTAAELAEVEIFADDVLIETATASEAASGSKWSADVDFSSLDSGTLLLTALSTGATSGEVMGVYDNNALALVTVSSPEYGNGEISVTWTASDDISAVELWYKKENPELAEGGTWANTGLPAQSGTDGVFLLTPAQGDGTYYFAARATDMSGNAGPQPMGDGDSATVYTASANTVVITTNSGQDFYSETASVTLEGTCTPDSAAILVNGAESGVVYTPGTVNWSYSDDNLTEGENLFEVTAQDMSGNVSDPASIRIYFGTEQELPTSSAFAPDHGNGELSIEWTASDISGIASVQLWYKKESGGTWTKSDLEQIGESGAFQFTPAAGDGLYYFASRAVDILGNREPRPTGDGDTRTVYDNTPPGSPVIATPVVSDASVTLNGTCSPDTDTISVNGPSEGVVYTPGETSWTYAGKLQLGANTFELIAQDAAGNASDPASVQAEGVDTVAPTSAANAPAFANAALSVLWTASDGFGVASTELWYKKESDGIWADTGLPAQSGESGSFDFTPADGDGIYHFATRATDTSGNVEEQPSEDGDSQTIYDTVAPAPDPVITTNSGNDFSVINNPSVTLEGTCAADTNTIYVNGSPEGSTYTPGSEFWTYTGKLKHGANKIVVASRDNAGNMSYDDITVTASDTIAPRSSASSPEYGLGPLSVTWTASDAFDVASARLWYKKEEGGTWADTGLPAQSGDNLSLGGRFIYVPTSGDGSYYFATRATDTAGNTEAQPSGNGDTLTIFDTAAPEPPVITSNGGADYATDTEALTLTGTCSPDTVSIYVNGSARGVSYTAGQTSWTYVGTLNPYSDNVFTVTAKDSAGNVSAGDSIGIYFGMSETVPPGSKAVAPTYGNGTLSILWTASDDDSGVASVELWYKKENPELAEGGTWANTKLPEQTGNSGIFRYTPAEGDGTYYFATRAEDKAGNKEALPSASGDDSTIYDITPPDPPLIITNAGEDFSVSASSLTLNGTCASDSVTVYVNGSATGVTFTPKSSSWHYRGTLETGDNTFSVTAADSLGNVSDATAITVARTESTGTMTITLEWDAGTESDIGRYVLYWGTASRSYDADSETDSDDVIMNHDTSYTVKNLTAGELYYFAVKSVNTDGEFSDFSNEAAIPAIMSPEDDFYFDGSKYTNFTFSGTAAELSDVEIFAGDTLLETTQTSSAAQGAAWSAEVDFSSVGEVSLTAKSTGATSEAVTGTYAMEGGTGDTTAPESRALVPSYGNDALMITWTASDTSGLAATALWYRKGRYYGEWKKADVNSQPGTSGTFIYTPTEGDADYYFATRATDNAGNKEARPSGDGDGKTVYDTEPPDAPVVEASEFSAMETLVTLSGTCGEDIADILVNGSDTGVTFTAGDSEWSYRGTVGQGEHSFVVSAADAAGNTADADPVKILYTPDFAAPVSAAAELPFYGNGAISVAWTASDDLAGLKETALWYKKESHGVWTDTGLPAQSGESGSFDFTPADGDGIYHFATRALDLAGNAEDAPVADGDTRTIYDTIPPEPPVFTTNEGENYQTRDSSLILEGTCSADSVAIRVNGSGDSVTHTSGDTSWTYMSVLQTGENSFHVTAIDAAENMSYQDVIVIEHNPDVLSPNSTAVAPTYSRGEIAVEWTASDTESGLASTALWYKKEAYGNWTDTGLAPQTGESGVFVHMPADGEGSYFFATVSTDNAGQSELLPEDGDTLTIYDISPPDIPIITTNGGEDYQTSHTSVELAGTCAADTVVIYVNGSENGVHFTPGDTSWTYGETVGPDPGAGNFEVTAQDIAGNISYSASLIVTYEPDTVVPDSFATAPLYANAAISVNWTASDDASGVASVKLWYKNERTGMWMDTESEAQSGESGTFVYTPADSDGVYYFATRATDKAGNEELLPPGTGDATVIYDTAAPDVPVITTNSGADFSSFTDTLTLEGSCSADTALIYVNGTEDNVLHTPGGMIWTHTGTLSQGENPFSVTARDAAGNLSAAVSIRVSHVRDTTPPVSEASSPIYGKEILSIVWTASDEESGVASVELWYKKEVRGIWVDTGLDAQSGVSGTFAYMPVSADGNYFFATVSTDRAGNEEALPTGSGESITIYDTVSPDSDVTGQNQIADTLSLTWNAADMLSGVASVELWYKKGNSSTWAGTGLPAQSGESGTFDYEADTEGLYFFATVATDNAGNAEFQPSGNGDIRVIYDTTPLSPPIITTNNGDDYSSAESVVTLEGTCSGETIAIYVNGMEQGVSFFSAIIGDSSWEYVANLQTGANLFRVTAEDTAGNMSAPAEIVVTFGLPVGGYTEDHVIPADQAVQSENGDGLVSIHFRIREAANLLCSLRDFEYSTDGGSTWNAPAGGDDSEALGAGWSDNRGAGYASAGTFDAAPEHSFTFDTRHSDIAGLDQDDQNDIRIRFMISNGAEDSISPLTSEDFRVDNLAPEADISYSPSGLLGAGDMLDITAVFSEFMADAPRISIHYEEGADSDPADMSSGVLMNTWLHVTEIPAESDGEAVIAIDATDAAGNPVVLSNSSFAVDGSAPFVEDYVIDYENNFIDIIFSESDMRNAGLKESYSFDTGPDFAEEQIIDLGAGVYRLPMISIPDHTIFTLTLDSVTDASGNAVAPDSIRLNDDNGNDMADDQEADIGTDDPDGDMDADGLSNADELANGTDIQNPDTDGDGLPDGWEVGYGLDPLDSTDINGADGDLDDDGWSNTEEYENGSDPSDSTSAPEASSPSIVSVTPHDGAGLDGDTTRIPTNTSFHIRIQDDNGIDIAEADSVVFTIDDGVNAVYTRNLDHPAVRRMNISGDSEKQVFSDLRVVYDRSLEEAGDYAFDTIVRIHVEVANRIRLQTQGDYQFRVETLTAYNNAEDNLPPEEMLNSDDPALEGAYDTGARVTGGPLEGAMIVYDSGEPVTPTFGPTNELPTLMLANVFTIGIPLNLQPPTMFDTPVKLFIPCPGDTDASDLNIYFYDGKSWELACDADGNVMPGGEAWMVPGSRVNHSDTEPQTVEIRIWHFSGAQAGQVKTGVKSDDGGGSCFISAASFVSDHGQAGGLAIALIMAFAGLVYAVRRLL